jgi:hypothetical protein
MNGKTGEVIRYLIGLGVAGIVAYYTAQIQTEHRLTQTDGDVATIKTLEQAHFEEVQRSLIRIERFMERIEATGQDRSTGEPYSVQGSRR